MDLQTLQQECLACRRCRLCESRTHVVFGQGVPTAEVLFVGEGPGANEDAQGLPFVGRSGQLLDHYLEAVDLSRDKNVYIANIVKCRPPQNRDPLPEESAACLPWLRQQFQLLLPLVLGDLLAPFLFKVAHSSTLLWLSLYILVQIYSNLTRFCKNAPPETKKKRFFLCS